MPLDSNLLEEIEIELESKPIKDIIQDVDISKVKIKDYKPITEFISGLITNSYKFPVIISLKDNKTVLINSDKLKVLALFLKNQIHLDTRYTNLHYDEDYASDFSPVIINNLQNKMVDIVYIKDNEFTKEVMDNLAKELNFYPYPNCIKQII